MSGPQSDVALSFTWQAGAVVLGWGMAGLAPYQVTPDTLRYNQLVPADWRLEPDAVFGGGRSRFSYSNGVEVEAAGEWLAFRQAAQDLGSGAMHYLDLAVRYSDSGLLGERGSVSMEFRGVWSVDAEPEPSVGLTLMGLPDFEGVGPEMVNVGYDAGGFRISLMLSIGEDEDAGSIIVSGSVYHHSAERMFSRDRDFVRSVIAEAMTDLERVVGLSRRMVIVVPAGGKT